MKTLDEMIREYRIELYKACDGRIGLQAWKYKGKPGAEEEIRANKDALVAELVRRERERKTNEERKHREHILNLQKEYPANLPDLNVVTWSRGMTSECRSAMGSGAPTPSAQARHSTGIRNT